MKTILVVDDEPTLARALLINFRARGYTVEAARTGQQALRAAVMLRPDLVILDLGLPDMDGIDVIVGLRAWTAVPITVLSARHTSDEKIRALEAGADDYVTKPFDFGELVARARAAMRRIEVGSTRREAPTVSTATFDIDLAAGQVTREGRAVRLTPTEWHILDVLANRVGRLVTQQQLLAEVWGPGYENQAHYLRVYLAALRRKLEREPSKPRHLITEPGLGYRLVP